MTIDSTWNDNFYYFVLFRSLNGPEVFPGKESDNQIEGDSYYTEADLSNWIRQQNQSRKRFLEGKVSEITAHQIKVLDSVAFPWVRDSSERWDAHFRDLVAYKEQYGHCNPPTKVGKLGTWVKNQRAAYNKLYNMAMGGGMALGDSKKTTAVITPDQIQLLSDLGFKWKVRNDPDTAWNNNFERLVAFAQENGHCKVSPKEHDISLGRWVNEQRNQYKARSKGEKSNMSDERIARLQAMTGWEWVGHIKLTEEEKKAKKKESDERRRLKKREERAVEKAKKKEQKKRKRIAEMIMKQDQKKSKKAKKKKAAASSARQHQQQPPQQQPQQLQPRLSIPAITITDVMKKSASQINDEIEKSLAAQNIPVVSQAVKLAAGNIAATTTAAVPGAAPPPTAAAAASPTAADSAATAAAGDAAAMINV